MRTLITTAAVFSLVLCSHAMAQPSSDRFFGYMDRNQDGRLDGDELQRMPGPFRDGLRNARVDLSRGLSRDDFARVMPRIMEDMRRQREQGGGFSGGFRGGPPPGGGDSRGGDSRGDGRGPSDYRGRDEGRGSDSRGRGRSEPKKPTRWTAKARDRVTLDLDETWKANDLNGDGQIGLYEWDRAKLSEFLRLDTNHDGLLTPREISFASDAAPAPTSNAVVASTTRTSPGPATSSRPTSSSAVVAASPAATGGRISPVQFDPESSEGRWASYVFKRLDKNRDGTLAADEWKSSQTTRRSFEKYGAKVSFPTDFEKFAPWLVAVQRAEKKR